MASQVLKIVNPGGLYYDTLLLTTGIVIQFAVAYYFEWIKIATKELATKGLTTTGQTYYVARSSQVMGQQEKLSSTKLADKHWQKA